MLPEVQAFRDEVHEAEMRYQANRRKVNRYDDLSDGGMTYNKARDILEKETRAAWNKLQESENKLVAWIGKNDDIFQDYRRQGLYILESLPCSLEDLNRIASEQGWCSVWSDFVKEATDDGIISIDYAVKVKYNAYDWDDFYSITLNDRDTTLNRDFFIDLYKKGMKDIQFDLNRDFIRVKVEVVSRTLS